MLATSEAAPAGIQLLVLRAFDDDDHDDEAYSD